MATSPLSGAASPFVSLAASSALLAACAWLLWFAYKSKFGRLPGANALAGVFMQMVLTILLLAVAFVTLARGADFVSRVPGIAVLLLVGFALYHALNWTKSRLEPGLGALAGRANAYLVFLAAFVVALVCSIVAAVFAALHGA